MKKLVAVFLLASMLLCSVLGVFAEDATVTEPLPTECVPSQEKPDWLITELSQDQMGADQTTVETYREPFQNWDAFEYMEIYNNSGKALNLYDYAMGYNGSGRSSANFEYMLTEITPFLTNNEYVDAPGNYLDGSVIDGSMEIKKTYAEVEYTMKDVLNETMKNPATCVVEPGECVVLWFVYCESYRSVFNNKDADGDGTGMTVADFRKHWNIPETTKVILVDGNSASSEHGNAHNFNIKNSDCGTYSIVKYTEELNQACNTAKEDGSQADGFLKHYYTNEDIVCWATMDITNGYPLAATANTTTNFVPDVGGRVAEMYGYVWSGARMFPIESDATCTPGALTNLQKLFIEPQTLAENTIVHLAGNNAFDLLYTPVVERTETHKYNFAGFTINGENHLVSEDYIVPAGGVTSFAWYFEEIAITTKGEDPVVTPEVTTTETPNGGEQTPEETTTTKPDAVTTAPNNDTEPAGEKSCGGVAVAAQVIALVCGVLGFALIKRK